ncbi:MAG: hypothetical protein HZA31_04025 [Opitutae bacterium]|nr:hypothetical protein [Opitutae bacterium]
MKRIEVKLSLPIVAPLLDVMKTATDTLRQALAAPLALHDLDAEWRETWTQELLEAQNAELQAFLGLFDQEFFATGIVSFDEDNAEIILRACTALRLRLRITALQALPDAALEEGNIDPEQLSAAQRNAFMCYLFLATIQELIIKHLDAILLGEADEETPAED